MAQKDIQGPKFYLDMSNRLYLPLVFLDALAIIFSTLIFLVLGVFAPSAFVALGAIVALLIVYKHRFIQGARSVELNFVQIESGYFSVHIAQLFGPTETRIRYDNVSSVQVVQFERFGTWAFQRYLFSAPSPHWPPPTGSFAFPRQAVHCEVQLHHPIRVPFAGERLNPFVTMLHFGVEDAASLAAQLAERCPNLN